MNKRFDHIIVERSKVLPLNAATPTPPGPVNHPLMTFAKFSVFWTLLPMSLSCCHIHTECCLTVAAGPCLPNGPITHLSPYFTRNPCTAFQYHRLSVNVIYGSSPAHLKMRVRVSPYYSLPSLHLATRPHPVGLSPPGSNLCLGTST